SRSLQGAFGTNDRVRIGLERYRRGSEASVAEHLDVVEVRKHEFASRVGNREAALVPEFHQPLLCVSAHSGVSLRPTELDTGVDKLTSQTRASEFPADSQAL